MSHFSIILARTKLYAINLTNNVQSSSVSVDDIFVSCSSLILVSIVFMLWIKYSITDSSTALKKEPVPTRMLQIFLH